MTALQTNSPTAPSIAVIVPNRNDARFIVHCLDSVLNQEIRPEELIIVDDQSTDDSVKVIRRRIEREARVRLIVNPVNLGTNDAAGVALEQTRCDYILALAANDLVLPGIFARAKSCLARHPGVGIWSAMANFVDEAGQFIHLHPSAVIALRDAYFPPERCVQLALGIGNWFTGPTMIYRREAILAAGGFEHAYKGLADWLMGLVIAAREGAAYSPEPFAAMRVHAGSFLSRTLADPDSVEALLREVHLRGPLQEPRLFTPAFIERFDLRVRFAALRSGVRMTPGVAARQASGLRRLGLDAVERVIPRRLHLLRVAASFLLMRPFDVLPTLWYRFAGWAVVLVRLRLRGRALQHGH